MRTVKLTLPVLLKKLEFCRIRVGAFTVTVTFAAKLTLCVAPQVLGVANLV